jgi:aryl-alcohol dehydrogenase-like predicted oxidoreductase
MRGMDDLVRMGKVHYPAVSNTPAWVIAEANTLARLSGWTPFAGMQVQYSLAERAPERELFPLAEAHGMAVCAWAPLAAGLILRPDLSPGERTARGGVSKAEHHRIAVGLAAIARRLDASAAQLALAWMRYRPGVEVIPVAAADSADQVRENMASLELELSPDVVAELDALTAIDLGYPSTYLSWDLVVNMATAFQPHRLRPPRGRA